MQTFTPPPSTTSAPAVVVKVDNHRRRPGPAGWRGGLSVLRITDWRVPTKLAAVLVLPAVAFLVIAGVQINASVSSAARMDSFADSVKVGRELTELVHQLQRERDRTAGVLARAAIEGTRDANAISAQLSIEWTAVDQAITAFGQVAGGLGPEGSAMAASVLTNDYQQIQLIRQGVQNRWLRLDAVFEQYTSVVSHLIDLGPDRAQAGNDRSAGHDVESLRDLAEIKELSAQLRGRIFAATNAGTFSPDDFGTFSEVQARQAAAVQRFRTGASQMHVSRYDEALRGTAISSVTRLQQEVIGRARGFEVGVRAEEWWRASTAQQELIRYVEQDLLEEAIAGAERRSVVERRNAFLATSAIVLIMLGALLLSWIIGRSMARSLRQLRAQALDVAQFRLPQAIERLRTLPRGESITVDTTSRVQSSDEIGEVAEAFTAVHQSAVSLAVEQAVMRRKVNEMFINLARRSQTLVERQLQLLDSLEVAETDPDQLANLFRLDHLATRMRRNDENLLVLAGSEATRRWSQPVSLAAVTMAAMAEIEQYARIRHDVANDVFVVGHAVADIVHLLAELLENATTFSPPDTVVNVTGRTSTDGTAATIIVEDRGIGMGTGGLEEANERVSTAIAIDVAASERMGLVVVGHLAGRHGVKVRLAAGDEGVIAYVTLPERLLAEPPDGGGLYGTATGRLASNDEQPGAITIDAPSEPILGLPAIEVPAPAVTTIPLAEQLAQARTKPTPAVASHADLVLSEPALVGTTAPESGVPESDTRATDASPDGSTAGEPSDAGADAGSTGPADGVTVVASDLDEPPPHAVSPVVRPALTGASSVPSIVPVSAPPAVNGDSAPAANPAPGAVNGRGRLPMRRSPSRAEDIISAVSPNSAPAHSTRWWTRGGGNEPGRPASTPAVAIPRDPVIAGTSSAGLPIRAPLAQLPPQPTDPAPSPNRDADSRAADVAQPAPPAEPDPEQISSMLTSFYGGVHRAISEDDIPTVPLAKRTPQPITEPDPPSGGSQRDP